MNARKFSCRETFVTDNKVDGRLSGESYWSDVHSKAATGHGSAARSGLLLRLYRRVWGERNTFGRSYSSYLIDEVVLKPRVPREAGLKVLEVGCAPGTVLLGFRQNFSCDPYGIEYTSSGVKATQELFVQAGLDPENIVHADFFSKDFRRKYHAYFDICYSGGFIEHFRNPIEVIEGHLEVLKEGGLLLVTVPNLQGLNYRLSTFMSPDLLGLHNLEIMREGRFEQLFRALPLTRLFCGYLGTFSLAMHDSRPANWKRYIALMGVGFDALFGLFLRRALGTRHRLELACLSPYLVFLGRKHTKPIFEGPGREKEAAPAETVRQHNLVSSDASGSSRSVASCAGDHTARPLLTRVDSHAIVDSGGKAQ